MGGGVVARELQAFLASYNRPVAAPFHFEHAEVFRAEEAAETLRRIPAAPGVLALFGHEASAQPYLTRSADLRRRATRLLGAAEPGVSKRLHLGLRVGRVEYTLTGSEFESTLLLYRAGTALFGLAEARRRLKLRAPYFLRLTTEHAHPRVYTTNRLGRSSLAQSYGPFASRLAAERYADAVLDLFKLRRCHEDLSPHPDHPGCAYGEMKKCLAPCNLGCTAEAYAEEAGQVRLFFDTRGESLLGSLTAERERASAAMDFEAAAALHAQWQRVKGAVALADELVRPVSELRAIVVQPSARRDETQTAAVFLLERGCLAGPEPLSTLGVRAVKEQTSVGSSLFAQPLMLRAVPLGGEENDAPTGERNPEDRAAQTLQALGSRISAATETVVVSDYLSLLRRWYDRPEKGRTGELFYPAADGSWPLRRILRGAARAVLGPPGTMAETDRRAPALKTRVLHEGRPGVERAVAVLDAAEGGRTFTSRRRAKAAADTLMPSGSHPPEGPTP
jgi:hypothetical protein